MSVRNILDGTIPVGGVMPDNSEVKTLTADFVNVGPEGSRCTLSGGDIVAQGISTSCLEADVIRLSDTEVLYPTKVEDKQSIAVTYSDGETATLSNTVISETTNLNSHQHVLTCQTQITSTSKPIKQLIIPTGLDFTGRKTLSTGTTAALVNKTDLLLGLVHIYVESNQLMAKVVFSETPSYTSIAIKINIVFI